MTNDKDDAVGQPDPIDQPEPIDQPDSTDQPDPIDQLRAADPAAEVEASPGFVDAVLARTVDARPDTIDLTAERARRRPRWLPIVAVAASVAIIGGLGYGVGASAGGASNLAGGAAAPISLQAGGASTEEARVPNSGALGSKISGADMAYGWGFGRNTFSSSGLGTSESNALAYGFDARAASNAEIVGALAASFGIEGTPELRDGAWSVGPQDGTAPVLTVGLDGTLGFWFSDPRLNPWQCGVTPMVVDDSAEPTMPTTEPCEQPTGTLPSEDAAIDALRSIISAAGRDAGAFEFAASETWEGALTRSAQAWPIVNGQRIDQAWSVEVSEGGVVSASGALASLVELGDYPVISEQAGVDRLSDPRFGAQMTTMPLALRDSAVTSMESDVSTEWVPPTEPPATPTSGVSLAWPVTDVQIVSARLGLASQWQPDGSVIVVPAYEFTDSTGGVWSVIAVADSKLDFATE